MAQQRYVFRRTGTSITLTEMSISNLDNVAVPPDGDVISPTIWRVISRLIGVQGLPAAEQRTAIIAKLTEMAEAEGFTLTVIQAP